MEHAVNKFIY